MIRGPEGLGEWEALYDLRWRVLRAPWGQERGSERDEGEADSVHRVAVTSAGRVIGTGRVQWVAEGVAQVRYMAVEEAWRGRGVGAALLESLEREAGRRGAGEIGLNARIEVAEFYARRGYRAMGPGPVLFGRVEHVVMVKAPVRIEP
ncbi:MAG: GNAT family N-acetyltransferase [Verrucomicrobiae bacterium]|nr:GNAT family N-acetyltransferase [Verrucomicrobiae bacterium]